MNDAPRVKAKRYAVEFCLIAGIAVVALLYVGHLHLFATSKMVVELDFRSGRLRRIQYNTFTENSQAIEETWLSQVMEPLPGPPEWRVVRERSIRRNRNETVHYPEDPVSDLDAIRHVEGALTPNARRLIGLELLQRWRNEYANDSAEPTSHEYTWRVYRIVYEAYNTEPNSLPLNAEELSRRLEATDKEKDLTQRREGAKK